MFNRILKIDIFKKRTNENVVGYTNRCQDGSYVIFLDYDNIEYEWLINEINYLQEMYRLGDFYIFSSSENCFHVVCLDKVPLEYYLKILRSSSVDPNYINVPLYSGRKIWTLRVTDKTSDKRIGKNKKGIIDFKAVVVGSSIFKQSKAHTVFVENHFEGFINMGNNLDELEELILARYPI